MDILPDLSDQHQRMIEFYVYHKHFDLKLKGSKFFQSLDHRYSQMSRAELQQLQNQFANFAKALSATHWIQAGASLNFCEVPESALVATPPALDALDGQAEDSRPESPVADGLDLESPDNLAVFEQFIDDFGADLLGQLSKHEGVLDWDVRRIADKSVEIISSREASGVSNSHVEPVDTPKAVGADSATRKGFLAESRSDSPSVHEPQDRFGESGPGPDEEDPVDKPKQALEAPPLTRPEIATTVARPKGIQNIGNTCYSSSMLQILYYQRRFLKKVAKFRLCKQRQDRYNRKLASAEKSQDRTTRLRMSLHGARFILSLQRFFASMLESHTERVNPANVLANLVDWDNTLLFQAGAQQDAVEFMEAVFRLVEAGLRLDAKVAVNSISEARPPASTVFRASSKHASPARTPAKS